MFVARPDLAPADHAALHVRTDDAAARDGKTWRKLLAQYNRPGAGNPFWLLPAWRLYANPAYGGLKERFGTRRLFILSAGWGLIGAE